MTEGNGGVGTILNVHLSTGKITREVFEDNTKSWSGDHCIDPELVPGVFFSNWKVAGEDLSLADMAPTIIDLFGLKPRRFHDGKVLALSRPEEK